MSFVSALLKIFLEKKTETGSKDLRKKNPCFLFGEVRKIGYKHLETQ